MTDALHRLWESSVDFYQRFDLFPPETKGMLRVFTEEYYETVEAALTGENNDLAEEGADLIVTLIGVLVSRGISIEHLEAAMDKVAAQNDAKTHLTHAINSAGKIARKG